MKYYLIIALFLFKALIVTAQSCPPNVTVDGHQFDVVHIGNQCFYLDRTAQYTADKLNSMLLGYVFLQSSTGSYYKSKVQSTQVTDYNYLYNTQGQQSCTVLETISMQFVINFEITTTFPTAGDVTANGTLTTTLILKRTHAILVGELGTSGTSLALVGGEVSGLDSQIAIDNPLFYNISVPEISPARYIKDRMVEDLERYFLPSMFGQDVSFIHKADDVLIPIDTQILGPTSICDQPIVLSLSNGHKGQWEGIGISNSITVTSPGVYITHVTDLFCNRKKLSISITQAPNIPDDFINAEALCTGKVKLKADGFASVHWSTGATSNTVEIDQSGIYVAEATNQDGCKGTDKIQLTLNAPCLPANGVVLPLTIAAICSDFPNITRRWKITNPNASVIRMDWEIVGTIQKTWLDVPTGESYLTTIAVPLNQNFLKTYWHNEKGEIKSLQQTSIASKCPKTSTSSFIATNGKLETELKVFPNPTKDMFVLEVPSEDEQTLPMQILSSSGVVWYSGTVHLSQGQNYISNDISKFDNGAYVIKLGNETIRFMKQ